MSPFDLLDPQYGWLSPDQEDQGVPVPAAPGLVANAPAPGILDRLKSIFMPSQAQAAEPQGGGMDIGALLPGMILTQLGQQMRLPREQRNIGAIPQTILGVVNAQRAAEKDKLTNALTNLKLMKELRGETKYGSQIFVNTETGEKRYAQQGEVMGPKWEVYEKPVTKEPRSQSEIEFWKSDPAAYSAFKEAQKVNQGLEIQTMPDGTFRIVQGAGAGKGGGGAQAITGMNPKTAAEVEKGLLDVTEGLSDTSRIAAAFKPELATLGGQWEGIRNRWKDKLGYTLDPASQLQLNEFTKYRAEAGRVFANTLKKLSGTAVTEPEMKRQEVYLINPGTGIFDGDSPSQVQQKLANFVSFQRNAIARLNYIRKNGLSIRNAAGDVTFGNISLDRMPGVIKGYGQRVEKELTEKGVEPGSPEMIQEVQRRVAEHFGLVQ